MLTPARRQKLAYQKFILKYFDNSVEEHDGDNLLGDDPLGDNSPTRSDSNINMDTKTRSNFYEDMTSNNLLEKNSGINIEDLF